MALSAADLLQPLAAPGIDLRTLHELMSRKTLAVAVRDTPSHPDLLPALKRLAPPEPVFGEQTVTRTATKKQATPVSPLGYVSYIQLNNVSLVLSQDTPGWRNRQTHGT